MEDKTKVERGKIVKKKLPKPAQLIGAEKTSSGINIIRNVLKIPPTSYDTMAAKQMHNYKHSKAAEMFKERNKKYTCVEENYQEPRPNSTAAHSFVNPIDILNQAERDHIKNYEMHHQQKQSSSSFVGSNSGGNIVYFGERPANFGPTTSAVPPLATAFDHSVVPITPTSLFGFTPPNVSSSSSSNCAAPTKTTEATKPSATAIVTPTTATTTIVSRPTAVCSIKSEQVETVEDEIPSFQTMATSSATNASTAQPEKNEADRNREQTMLWELVNLCKEELVVNSTITTEREEIDAFRRKIEQLQRAMQAKEQNLVELNDKKSQLESRKLILLRSVERKDLPAHQQQK